MFRCWLFSLVFLFVAIAEAPRTLIADGPKILKLGTIELQKNGSGYRKKSLLTLYAGTLYLTKSSSDGPAIVSANEAMAIRIRITSGFVSQAKMIAALNEGFQTSTGGATASLAEQIKEFRVCFSEPIQKNDVFIMSYIPGTGVLVHKNGKQKGVIAGLEFKQALFGIWISKRPADPGLRTAMLGTDRR